jgi:RHS repeat-associated protein
LGRCDCRGRLVRETGSAGDVVTYARDGADRLVQIRNAVGATVDLGWDAEGRLSETLENGRRVHLSRRFQAVVGREEPSSRQAFDVDTEGRLVAVVNEAGERYVFDREECGRVVGETAFDGRRTVYRRDRAGRVVLAEQAGGRTTRYGYAPGGALASVSRADGELSEFECAPGSLVVALRNRSAHVTYAYDAAGRPVLESSGPFAVTSVYDGTGERRSLETTLGARLAVRRDPDGLPVEYTVGHGEGELGSTVAVYHEHRAEVARELPGRVRLEWIRDAEGRPLERDLWRRDASGAERVVSTRYEWDGTNLLVAVTESDRGRTEFFHDTRARLQASVAADGAIVHRCRDAVGNVYRSHDGSDRIFGSGNRLERAGAVTYVRDANAALVERHGPEGVSTYRWNAAGLVAEVERPGGLRVRFEYDARARRIRKTVTRSAGGVENLVDDTRFHWDGALLVHEDSTRRGLITWYWDSTGLLIAKEHDGARFFVTCDHLGTPAEMFDSSGHLVWRMRLDIYGVASFAAGSAEDCPFRWLGQYADEETSLYYTRYRYYDPEAGSFISPDPSGLLGGTNVFAYVRDVNIEVDPFGLHVVQAWLNGKPGKWWHQARLADAAVDLRAHGARDYVLACMRNRLTARQLWLAAVDAVNGAYEVPHAPLVRLVAERAGELEPELQAYGAALGTSAGGAAVALWVVPVLALVRARPPAEQRAALDAWTPLRSLVDGIAPRDLRAEAKAAIDAIG